MRSLCSLLFFQAEQDQFHQPILKGEVLQLHILHVLRVPDLDTVLQMGPHEGSVERDNLFLLATPLLLESRIPLAFQAASTIEQHQQMHGLQAMLVQVWMVEGRNEP